MTPDGNAGRFLLAMGGFLGFSGAFLCALKIGHGDVSGALFRASVGMIVGALLMKWFASAIYTSAREARAERLQAAAKHPAKDSEAGGEPAAEPARATR